MENYYSLLGITQEAEQSEIKKAFREKAKKLHPDIAGSEAQDSMRHLLAAYEVLIDSGRRERYDRALNRYLNAGGFDYRSYLRDLLHDEESDVAAEARAKLIFFELLHLEEAEAVRYWREGGGLDYHWEHYLDREDFMDGAFMLAEELIKQKDYYNAFILLAEILREERKKPYFKHFTEDVEALIKELVRVNLRRSVGEARYADCLLIMLQLGFPSTDEKRWEKTLKKIRQ
ncbi:MAG: DnaJ domain-containing protein [Spirochaetaceae bacterium]|jgi:curved DNA-binding protein CbpA|nr:DnaJ domain-containing protein [Spirochaetaceae bacterium]